MGIWPGLAGAAVAVALANLLPVTLVHENLDTLRLTFGACKNFVRIARLSGTARMRRHIKPKVCEWSSRAANPPDREQPVPWRL
jgi:hypothetical protein